MANAPSSRRGQVQAAAGASADIRISATLEAEILEGLAEFDRGEYIELTPEQLEHAAATGEWPWPDDESRG